MLELEGQLKRWGNSYAFWVSKDRVRKSKMKINQKFKLLVIPERNILKETFGTLKFKKPTEQMMKEIDKELYNG